MIDTIRDILLQHKGKTNKITSGEIAKELGIIENATYAKTRKLIFDSAKKHKLPLAANTSGYYLISNKKEFDEYIANLDSRIKGIEERKQIIAENYNYNKNKGD